MGPIAAIRAYLARSRALRDTRSPQQVAEAERLSGYRGAYIPWIDRPAKPGGKPADAAKRPRR